MKAALFFRLPEDQADFRQAQLGAVYKAALEDMDEYLRSRLKYDDGLDTQPATEALQAARDRLRELVNAAEGEP